VVEGQDGGSDASPVEQALAGGIPQRVGWYRFHFADERWEWSAEVEGIHGYEPGTATPTTELILRHKHPDDYDDVAATLHDIRRTHKPFSARHRIITVQDTIREVVVIGEQLRDDTGEVVGTHGYYIDVTPTRDALISDAVAEIADNRAVIEQVKGILRVVYRIEPEVAFDVLRWRSQETNVKLRALAEQLMADFVTIGGGERLPPREVFDHLLMTAHQRIRAHGAGRRS
jgi:hypothetical protein